ncbi:MAG: glycine/sarcosine/betaine reductase selenoprotein B family protein [Chloroflexota bacterium]
MARMSDFHPELVTFLRDYEYADIEINNAWQTGPSLRNRRVALISSAGLRRRSDRAFTATSGDYRILPVEKRNEIVQDHISTWHDRTGFSQDLNVILPLECLTQMAEAGEIGSVAQYHYSFMGAVSPTKMESAARKLATLLHGDGVDAVVFCPV